MALSIVASQSEDVINVSLGAQSSPFAVAEQLQNQDAVEVVEDSIKETAEAPQPATLEASLPPQQGEYHDELYSLSPQGRASLEKRMAAASLVASPPAKRGELQQSNARHSTTARNKQDKPNLAGAVSESGMFRDLVTNGATVHKSKQSNALQTPQDSHADFVNGRNGEGPQSDPSLNSKLGMSGGGLVNSSRMNKPANTQAEYMSKPSQSASIHLTGAADKTTNLAKKLASTMAPAVVPTSAMAALQKRRQGRRTSRQEDSRGITTSSPITNSKSTSVAPHATPTLQRDPNLQTTARPGSTKQQAEERRSAGKQQPRTHVESTGAAKFERYGLLLKPAISKPLSRKNGMLAGNIPTPTEPVGEPHRERKAATQATSERRNMAPSYNLLEVNGSDHDHRLKCSSNSTAQSRQRKRTIYDLPQSLDEETASRPAKKPKTKAAPNSKPRVEARSCNGEPKTNLSSPRRNPRRSVRQNQGGGTIWDIKTNNTSARTKSARESAEREAATPSSTRNENPEAFEQSVVDDGNAVAKPAGSLVGVNATAMDDDPSPLDKAREMTVTTPAAQDTAPRKVSTSPQTQGATQQDAIILSDGNESNSPSATTPRSDKSPSTGPLGTVLHHAAPMTAKTPTIYHSSPPLGPGRAAMLNGTGLMDIKTSQRATIISFDKAGPRNQGSISFEKQRGPDAARSNRSSLAPSALSEASKTEHRFRPVTKQQAGMSPTPTSVKSFKRVRQAPLPNVAKDVSDALTGFMKNSSRCTDEEMGATHRRPAIAASASQSKPSTLPQVEDDGVALVDNFDDRLSVKGGQFLKAKPTPSATLERTASQLAMPPPPPHAAKLPNSDPGETTKFMPDSRNIVSLQRKLADDAIERGDRKRSRDAIGREMSNELRVRKEIKDSEAIQSQRKPTPSENGASHKFESFMNSSRKASRQGSHGSQKVDMHGSPVPEGMNVPEQWTALETFSQLARLCSDSVENTIVKRKSRKASESQIVGLSVKEPEVLLSNSKPLPAAPLEPSRTMTSVVAAHHNHPSKEHQIQPQMSDPFARSEESRKQTLQESTTSSFVQKLRQAITDKHASDQPSTGLRKASEDLDETLVASEQTHREFRGQPSLRSESSSSVSSSSSKPEDTSHNDVGSWRKALQPHQMNLFDQLVVVSHTLVRHLVDRETAARGMVEEYRLRGTALIEQMELDQAREYQQHVQRLEENKKRLSKELSDCNKSLKESMAAVKDMQGRRSAAGRGVVAKKLESVMATYC